MRALRRALALVRRHKHGEEVLAEAVGIDIAWGWIAGVLGAAAASAAISVVATQQSAVYHPPYSLSVKGAAFITRHEGVRYHPYNDPSGKPICTVGVGHVLAWRGCTAAELRETFTPGQVTTLLLHDAASAETCVREKITHRIDQAQFDALVDLTFNAGCGSLDYSGIANEVDAGQLERVPGTLSVTAVTAGGRYLPGLKTRRVAEGILFAHGYYGAGIGHYLPPKLAKKRKPAKPPCGIERPGRPPKMGCRYVR